MASTTRPELDVFDRQLLDALQRDNRTPMRVLAEQVHLSTAAVHRRIRRMEDLGVISANVAVVDPDRVGQVITLLVEVQVDTARTVELDALKRFFSGPEVQQCYYVTGNGDFMLVMTVGDMSEYDQIARRLFHDNPAVKWFRTIVVLGRVKVGLTVTMRN
ncbi:MAG TPA: Lrp/AsnC family transcriptional regulator [Rubrivivax sp.]|nr:Lrp/AsnC family transcriptional regulator [Rubrivivax sp.]